ncbi:hypothetical protein HALLA_14990 [Halostagnicola larsenii XH-48]|uniref:Uncharacterized protein n=1 Tax=Halostagnicola larsenii XH-48 TaxID=797299 RepID=W0JUX0_9EURY|nr:hypothetical protein HALLA_14990 [Halostagnicola larsenii XH-48]
MHDFAYSLGRDRFHRRFTRRRSNNGSRAGEDSILERWDRLG